MDCMGCGIQRAISLIFQGNFAEALHMYPAIYTLAILLGLVTINTFKNYKLINKLIIPLGIINLILIVGNFIFKTFLNNH